MSAILFMIAAVLYAGALMGAVCARAPRAGLFVKRSSMIVAASAVAVHVAGVVVRGASASRLPVQNQYESVTVAALMAVLAGVVVSRIARHPGARLAGFASACVLLTLAHGLGMPGELIEREAPILSTASLLKFHVTTIIAGYGLCAVGGVLGAAWLVRRKGRERLAGAMATTARLAFWILGVGVLLGAWWAHRAWGRWWAFDAKETWALLTWLVYFVPVHAAAVRGDRRAARVVAWSGVVGMVVMLWSYFGVNLLLVSLHAYA